MKNRHEKSKYQQKIQSQSFLVKITNLFDKQDQCYCPRLNIKIDEMPYILNVKK